MEAILKMRVNKNEKWEHIAISWRTHRLSLESQCGKVIRQCIKWMNTTLEI